MNIIFTSESIGKASKNTRRILDRYATRIGSDSWEASLTEEGLNTVKSLLNRASSRKSSIACHRITNHGSRVLVWTVGNSRMFNRTGACATGSTKKRLRKEDANMPYLVRLIIRIVSLAGLLHDIGKANTTFLNEVLKNSKRRETFRHEAVSAMMLAWLSGHNTDSEWVEALLASIDSGTIGKQIKASLKSESQRHTMHVSQGGAAQFLGARASDCEKTPILFGLIWLITSHHRLPSGEVSSTPLGVSIDASEHARYKQFDSDLAPVDSLVKNGLPWENESWTTRLSDDLKSLAILVQDSQFEGSKTNLFTALRLLGRPAFQLADHIVSSSKKADQTPLDDYAYANSVDEKDGSKPLGQRLYRHLVDVSRQASAAVQELLSMKKEMPGVDYDNLPIKLTKQSDDARYAWQDACAKAVRSNRNKEDGAPFFGVLIAGLGSGKTLCSVKIMASFKPSMRVVFASPLRSLTLQSGSAFESIGFSDDEMATIIGDPLIQKIYDVQNPKNRIDANDDTNSHQQNELTAMGEISEEEEHSISVSGGYTPAELQERVRILKCLDEKNMRMVATPVLAATLDTVIKLGDGRRGSYISHLLRIASSDMIIDEVDMYSSIDLIVIGRLIEACGFWKSRVILSSATLSPIIANALFQSYNAGLAMRNCMDGTDQKPLTGWFSNVTPPLLKQMTSSAKFAETHSDFAKSVVSGTVGSGKRKVAGYLTRTEDDAAIDANKILLGVKHLHARTSVALEDGRRFSFGCVQVVNVNHCQEITRKLCDALKEDDPDIEFRVFALHGCLSIATRNMIDRRLNVMLNRKGAGGDLAPLKERNVRDFVSQSKTKNIVVILVSTMETTGRDHDFDWGIIESRQERDIIQFVGRIRRHRESLSGDGLENVLLWDAPLKWDGSPFQGNANGKTKHPFSFFGVADITGKGLRYTELKRKEFDPLFGWMPNYKKMMELTYGNSKPFITPNRVLVDEYGEENETPEIRQDNMSIAYTVRACETARLRNALLCTREDKYGSLCEWLTTPNQAQRLLNTHQKLYRFRSGWAKDFYWRDDQNDWYFATVPGREWDLKTSARQGKFGKVELNEKALLFSDFCEDDEIAEIHAQTTFFSRYDHSKLSGVYFNQPPPSNRSLLKYHWQIGIVKDKQ